MEEKIEETKKVEIKDAGIDKDVLDELKKEDILDSVSNEKQMRRLELNCYCELLAEVRHLQQSVENFLNVLTICSNRQITEFFTGIRTNIQKEQMAKNAQKIVEKSHQKPQKAKKNVK